MMLRSWSNTLVSVRQVTQRNAGRGTPGVDGQVALSSKARAEMAVRDHLVPDDGGPGELDRGLVEGRGDRGRD
jgi:RNA-directed DNA polymerase